jgi:hypothetical protein
MVCLIGLAFVVASAPAEAAKARKHKKVAGVHTTARVQSGHRGTNLFPVGPLYYNGNEYLGDDPDPFIRLQLWRDLGAHFGDSD